MHVRFLKTIRNCDTISGNIEMREHQENTPPRQEDIEAEDAEEIIFLQEDLPAPIADEDEEVDDEMDEFEEGEQSFIVAYHSIVYLQYSSYRGTT